MDVINDLHGMRISHRDSSNRYRSAGHFKFIAAGLLLCLEGDPFRRQLWLAHIDANPAIIGNVQYNNAGQGTNPDLAFVGQAFLIHIAGETARTIPALFNFTTIGIENPVTEVHICCGRRFDEQQLIEADAEVSVSQLADLVCIETECLSNRIDDDEIITETVHFCEL